MEYRNIEINWLGHSGFLIKKNNKIIYIDPFKLGDKNEKADILFITHSHYDHCSIEDIKKIFKPNTLVIGPSDIQSKIRKVSEGVDFRIIVPGSFLDINGIKVEGVSAYNINKGFHPRDNEWLGFVIDLGVRIYHAGDTDKIPEMKNIKADIVFLPVGGKVTMNAEEAAEVAEIIKPELAIPMHWGEIVGNKNDAERFVRECRIKSINARVLEKG